MIFVNVKMNIDHICHTEMFYNASLFFFSSAESCPVTVPAGKHWYSPLLWVRIHPGIQAVCNSFWGNVLGSWSNWIL